MLGEVGRGCGFARPALEIHDADNLKFFIAAAVRHVAFHFRAAILVEPAAQFLYLLDIIGAASARKDGRLYAFSFQMQFLQIAGGDTKKIGRFRH